MKKLKMIKKVIGMLVLVMFLVSCENALPPFALTKGITKKTKNNDTSHDNSWNNNNTKDNDNSQNGNKKPQEPGKPDLVAVSLEPGTGMPIAGKWEVWEAETYENGVIATIKNAGTADITTLFKVGVYARYNNPDVYGYSKLGTVEITSLKAGETKKIPMAISIPNNVYTGQNNYIGLWVDNGQNIKESDEDNNKGGYNKALDEYQLGGQALHLLHIHENRPDIVAESFTPPTSLHKGETDYASVTIKNTGHRDALGLFKVSVYARYNNPDVYGYSELGTVEITSLKAGETKYLSIPLLLNSTWNLNQNWYIGVWVDKWDNIQEMDRERKGDGYYNRGGYNGNTDSYEPGPLLKTVFYSE